FSKGPLSLNLRGNPYLLEMEEMQRRVVEAVECGATEVCLQGGIHPDFDGDYYVDVARAVKEVAPAIHVHGFTALEVTAGARHLVRTRRRQKETGGFTEFVPLPFVHMATPIFIQGKARRGPTFREVLLMHAVGRIAYRDTIPNVQASWVKCGIAGTRQVLQAGANDLGGTLMDENISRAAGASHGQELDEAEFRSIVEPIGRTLAQRTTLY